MTSHDKMFKVIARAQKRSERMERVLERCRGRGNAFLLANAYLQWLSVTSSGRYASVHLEDIYIDCAKLIQPPREISPIPDSCLVVMSRTYASGGHTRWVERWIESDPTRTYSLVLTYTQEQELPECLKTLVLKRGGEIMDISDGDIWTRSAKLRCVSMRFASVLVATHLDDVSPLLAYGVEDFPRPICLMNHGNHLFWPGVSIADAIIETGVWQEVFSVRHRGSKVSRRVAVSPASLMPITLPDKENAREQLDLPLNAQIVLTAGSSRKYRADDFECVIAGILDANPNAIFISLGDENVPVDGSNQIRRWANVRKRYGERVRVLPTQPHADFLKYCCAADVLIDSFPFTGGGVMNDAMRCGCPCVTIARTIIDPFKPFVRCVSVDEIISDTLILLKSPEIGAAVIAAYRAYCSAEHDSKVLLDVSGFMQGFLSLRHRLHEFTPAVSMGAPNEYAVLATRYDARAESYWRHVFYIQLIPSRRLREVVMRTYRKARFVARRILRWRFLFAR